MCALTSIPSPSFIFDCPHRNLLPDNDFSVPVLHSFTKNESKQIVLDFKYQPSDFGESSVSWTVTTWQERIKRKQSSVKWRALVIDWFETKTVPSATFVNESSFAHLLAISVYLITISVCPLVRCRKKKKKKEQWWSRSCNHEHYAKIIEEPMVIA